MDDQTVQSTGFKTKQKSYDLCFDRHPYFLSTSLKSGKCTKIPSFRYGNITYEPLNNIDGLLNHSFFLPEKPEPFENEETLNQTIQDFLETYCDYPENYRKIDVGYIKLTWIFDLIHTLGYRRAIGRYGTGKSTWLECMLVLSRLGYKQGATATAAGIYHKADLFRGSQGFDETEYKSNSQIMKSVQLVLNSGYSKKSCIVTRIVRGEPKTYNTYGPKFIAARTRFNDTSTESRCITHISRKSNKLLGRLDDDFYEEATRIRNMLLAWRIKKLLDPPKPNKKFEELAREKEIEPRLIEIYRPLTRTLPKKSLMPLWKTMNASNQLMKSYEFLDPWFVLLQAISDMMRKRKTLTMGSIANWINEEIKIDRFHWSAKHVGKMLRDMGFSVQRKWDRFRGTNAFTLILSGTGTDLLTQHCADYGVELPTAHNQIRKLIKK